MVRELKALEVTDSIPSPSTVVEQQVSITFRYSADHVTARRVYLERSNPTSLGNITVFLIPGMGFFLEFGDFRIAELFLLNLKWLLKQRHHLVIFA